MLRIDILLADELEQVRVRQQRVPHHRHVPRLGVGLRIVNGHVNVHVSEVDAMVSLGDAQGVGMRMPREIDVPHLIVDARGGDDKVVAFPLADRVAHPTGLGEIFGVFGKLAAVGEDLPAQGIHFEKDQGLVAGVHDFKRIRQRAGLGNALRHAARFGIVTERCRAALIENFLRPGQHLRNASATPTASGRIRTTARGRPLIAQPDS